MFSDFKHAWQLSRNIQMVFIPSSEEATDCKCEVSLVGQDCHDNVL